MTEQTTLFEDNPEYEKFVEKFKPKKTTDDCYTPPLIYETIKNWACKEYDIDPNSIVRPFYPGGDYENFKYPENCTVLDNPPFSILTQIVTFYLERKIAFFLFAPTLTAFASRGVVMRCNHLVANATITYENGAVVNTSFITSYGDGVVAQSAPELREIIENASRKLKRQQVKELPKYIYPNHVLTAAMLGKYSRYGVDFKVLQTDCTPIGGLDAQREYKKAIYGGGLLLSEKAASRKALAEKAASRKALAEKAAAEKAAAEKAAAEKAAAISWELSTREREIIAELSKL